MAAVCSPGNAESQLLTTAQLDFFESKIRPLLIENCYECHSSKTGESSGGLRLDTAIAIASGGDSGPALVKHKPDASLIIRAVEYHDGKLQMPPESKLAEKDIHALREWIAIGAPDPRENGTDEYTSADSPLDRDPAEHWAFRLPQQARIPNVTSARVHDPIDAIIADRSTTAKLDPNPTADRETLIRRLYFDLCGLPPSADEITRFVNSDDPAIYTQTVDSLLARPTFGERFGRHWLDVARYADTLGYTTAGKTREIEGSHRYRDWVIQAFAADLPYDEMLRLQLAADSFASGDSSTDFDAMGFLTIGRQFLNGLDTIDDRIDVISRGLLGLTVSCARCHDHKFDPIPTKDYYSLFSILSNSHQPSDAASPLMMVDRPTIQDHHVLVRGQAGNPGTVAPREYLTALRKTDHDVFRKGSGRSELADRIASRDNPLTARVMVNRLWMHLIGLPLVDSASDFGFRTKSPQIPEVLDDLAADFSEHWSIKRAVRRIVLSHTYRQSCLVSDRSMRIDPDNKWLCRANRRRRDFESMRDCIHVVADSLDRTVGGISTEITLDTPAPRRTIYARIDRQNLPSVFRAFDFASPDAHSAGRHFTTVPQQSLFLLNSKQMIDLARRVARAVEREASNGNPHALVTALYRRVLGRSPTPSERQKAISFLRKPISPLPETIDKRRVWSYGTAVIDDEARVESFHPLSVFRNNQWQASKNFPSDGPLGYANLGRELGHPGEGKRAAVVRRFTSPVTGPIRIIGMMGHRARQGDGVRTVVRIGEQSLFDQIQKSNNRPYGPIHAHVEKGQHIDFIADAGKTVNHDTFFWRIRIVVSGESGEVFETESTRDFSGPLDEKPGQTIGRFAQLAQVLMISNEFAFVD